MRRKRLLIGLLASAGLAAAALAGCGSSASSSKSAGPSASVGGATGRDASTSGHGPSSSAGVPAAGATGAQNAKSVGVEVAPGSPLVIRTGSITLSIRKARLVQVFDRVSAAAATLGGFVAGSSSNLAGGPLGSSLTIRVPSGEFASLVQRVDLLGKVESQTESGRDVTGAVVDLGARIRNLESEEAALRTLLSHAGSIGDILQVQDQLFGVEGEVEQLTAQQASLVNRATYATLIVLLSPLPAPAPRPKPTHENAFLRALRLAAHNTWVAARAVLLALGWAFPAIALGLLGLGGWRLRRRLAASRHRPVEASPSA